MIDYAFVWLARSIEAWPDRIQWIEFDGTNTFHCYILNGREYTTVLC